jgi:dCMP deaminase
MSGIKSSTVAIAYIPVLHRGYIDFIERAEAMGVTKLWLIGDEILGAHEELDYLNRKDRLRALSIDDMCRVLGEVTKLTVGILTPEVCDTRLQYVTHLVFPNEDVSRFVSQIYFPQIVNVTFIDIFLRWHRDNIAEQKSLESIATISVDELDRKYMGRAVLTSTQSFDWWRQIGAVLVKDGTIVLTAHNTHMPDPQSPNVLGDPRTLASRGRDINISTAAHAEEIIIGEAARRGISTAGATLYVTEFPCPYCARLIAHSGITTCYFAKGYSVLDGATLLTDRGVQLVRVLMDS